MGIRVHFHKITVNQPVTLSFKMYIGKNFLIYYQLHSYSFRVWFVHPLRNKTMYCVEPVIEFYLCIRVTSKLASI